MSKEEFRKSKCGLPEAKLDNLESSRIKRAAPQFYSPTTTCSTLTYKNWVEEGKVSPVQDQMNCGCCYIFASIAALESAFAIKYSSPPSKYSEQQLNQCIRNPDGSGGGGCDGGRPEWIWDSTKVDGGVVLSSNYAPYNQNDAEGCKAGLSKAPNTIVDKYFVVRYGDEETLKCSLANNGPHTLSMDFSGSIQDYKTGIFDNPSKDCNSSIINGVMVKPYDHAVTLVGFGRELNQRNVSTDYWLIKNSWGASWGMNGFIKVARNQNICHIGTDARLPVLAASTGDISTIKFYPNYLQL